MLNDKKVIIAIADAIGLFSLQELEELSNMLGQYFDSNLGKDHFWSIYDDSEPVGIAYYGPEQYTYGTWSLYLIAVHPNRQGEGIGGKLLRYVEQMLAKRGERLLLVETSGLPIFERTRSFYSKHGYEEEARIREFYKAGDDKIIFRKFLGSHSFEKNQMNNDKQ